tara:strand:+ start:313 stop:549 length:237 start_codon:yes stop_codon:yes gene_type:complete
MNALTKEFTDAVEKQFESLNDDVRKALEEAGTAKSILMELEQKMARRGGYDGGGSPTTWGRQVADSCLSSEHLAQLAV